MNVQYDIIPMHTTKQRILYGYPLGAITIAILVYGDFLLYVFISIMSLILMKEFYQLTGLRTERRIVTMRRWGYCLGLMILFFVYSGRTQYLDLLIVAFIMIAMIHRLANFPKQKGDFLRELAISILGGIYIGFFMSYFFRLKDLGIELRWMGIMPYGNKWLEACPYIGTVIHNIGWSTGKSNPMSTGPNWLVLLPIIGSWGYDFSAFFTGRIFGATKLAPFISPKKTVEGMIGGLIGCATANVLVAMFIGIDPRFYLFLFIVGLIMGTMCQLGDLGISTIKREAGAKDSASLIPGHGGLLDKYDGLLFVLPTAYYLIYFAYSFR